MNKCLKLKALAAGTLAALAFGGAQAAPVDFVFNTAAIAGSTTAFSFTADEITFTSIGTSTVTQTDTSAPFGVLGAADGFFEIGLTSVVNFQLNNLNVVGTGINIGPGGYELLASFTLTGTAGFVGPVLQATITGGGATVYYDPVQDSVIGVGAIPIATLAPTFGACLVTAPGGAAGVPDGSCAVTFGFDAFGVTDPGVWTLAPAGPDIGTLNATLNLDVDIDDIAPALTLLYPGFGVTCDPGMDGGADACVQQSTLSHDGSAVINVPEPATMALFGLGLLGVGGFARRAKRQ